MKSVGKLFETRDARCTARLDRIRVVSGISGITGKPPSLPGFRIVRDSFVAQQTTTRTYLRCRQLICNETGTRVYWQYFPQRRWLRPWRITIIGDDRSGLKELELARILPLCPKNELILAELAFDFGASSGIDQYFVRRRALFGKSRLNPARGGPGQIRYGTRNSAKLIRIYFKRVLNSYRVELELHSKFLRSNAVNQVSDLPVLGTAICPAHLNFVAVRWERLRRHLLRRNARDVLFERVKDRSESIHAVMRILRRNRVNNPHRFLTPVKENELVRKAAARWADKFKAVTDEA
jgi:hypothetical protein